MVFEFSENLGMLDRLEILTLSQKLLELLQLQVILKEHDSSSFHCLEDPTYNGTQTFNISFSSLALVAELERVIIEVPVNHSCKNSSFVRNLLTSKLYWKICLELIA